MSIRRTVTTDRRRDALSILLTTCVDQLTRKERIGPLIDDVVIAVHVRVGDIRRARRAIRLRPIHRRRPRRREVT